jgi:hypothetical protein
MQPLSRVIRKILLAWRTFDGTQLKIAILIAAICTTRSKITETTEEITELLANQR